MNTETIEQKVHKGSGDVVGRHLTFYLSGEEYCVDILRVQQIIQMEDITNVPLTPEYICGVINLRGKIIPVIDLRIKFGMPVCELCDTSCIVVLQLHNRGISYTAGIIIDEIREVVQITSDMISGVPEFGMAADTSFLKGIAQINESSRMIIDLDKIFSKSDLFSANI